jgi:predicted ATPase
VAPWLADPGRAEEPGGARPGAGALASHESGARAELCGDTPSVPPGGATSPTAGRGRHGAREGQGFPYWWAEGAIRRGWALAAQEQGEDGITQIRQGLAAYRAIGAEVLQSYYLAILVEAYGTVGQTEEALTVLTEALATVHTTGERFYEAELHRLQGELLWCQGPPDAAQAAACLQQALTIAR